MEIGLISKTTVTAEALFELAAAAFSMWREHGLEEPWMKRSLEEFKEAIASSEIVVATDTDSMVLLGMHCLRLNTKKKRAYGTYLAVSPKAQRLGIASQMMAYEKEWLRSVGITHLMGNTAADAFWAVEWHRKNGYKLIGFKRADANNLNSYVFRKQLVVWSLYSIGAFCRCRYFYTKLLSVLR